MIRLTGCLILHSCLNSTLGTDHYRTAYKLYRRHGYVDMNIWATALARWETAHQPTRLRAEPPGPEGFDFIEKLFEETAKDYLGLPGGTLPLFGIGTDRFLISWLDTT